MVKLFLVNSCKTLIIYLCPFQWLFSRYTWLFSSQFPSDLLPSLFWKTMVGSSTGFLWSRWLFCLPTSSVNYWRKQKCDNHRLKHYAFRIWGLGYACLRGWSFAVLCSSFVQMPLWPHQDLCNGCKMVVRSTQKSRPNEANTELRKNLINVSKLFLP